jgi:hypothetical protein
VATPSQCLRPSGIEPVVRYGQWGLRAWRRQSPEF